jgi:hypothetical protein
MPRKAKKKLAEGRPLKKIDWDRVDKLLESGCTGTQIAPHFNISPDTLYDRTMEEKGVSFSAYSQEKGSKGESHLHEAQYDKALSGDNTMLVWLGKVRLRQREVTEHAFSEDSLKGLSSLMDQVKGLQDKNEEKD